MSSRPTTSKLIEALQIFLKYEDVEWPTHCEHDTLWISGIQKDEVSEEDLTRLNELGFFYCDDDCHFKSYAYGSA